MLAFSLTASWSLAVAATDWRARRIPNLALLGLLATLVACFAWRGQGPFGALGWQTLAGGALGLAVGLPGYALGLQGAGDAKLNAVMGAWFGWPLAASTLITAALALGATSLITLLLLGPAARGQRLPYGVAMAAAACGVSGWQWWNA